MCILDRLAKTSVVGLVLSSSWHVLASPFAQHTDSLSKRNVEEDSICVPDADGIFRVGQGNLTRCLEQHLEGNFHFVERIDFGNLMQDEQDKYPLHNSSMCFSGSLIMFPYSLDNFNITRPREAALFSTVCDANIKANFTNAEVMGELTSALLAISLEGGGESY